MPVGIKHSVSLFRQYQATMRKCSLRVCVYLVIGQKSACLNGLSSCIRKYLCRAAIHTSSVIWFESVRCFWFTSLAIIAYLLRLLKGFTICGSATAVNYCTHAINLHLVMSFSHDALFYNDRLSRSGIYLHLPQGLLHLSASWLTLAM